VCVCVRVSVCVCVKNKNNILAVAACALENKSRLTDDTLDACARSRSLHARRIGHCVYLHNVISHTFTVVQLRVICALKPDGFVACRTTGKNA